MVLDLYLIRRSFDLEYGLWMTLAQAMAIKIAMMLHKILVNLNRIVPIAMAK